MNNDTNTDRAKSDLLSPANLRRDLRAAVKRVNYFSFRLPLDDEDGLTAVSLSYEIDEVRSILDELEKTT